MDRTPAAQMPSRRRTLLAVCVLLLLSCVIVYVFKDNWEQIAAALGKLSLWQVAAMIAIGLTYPTLEGVVLWMLVKKRMNGFKLWQAVDTSWAGTFCNVATFGVGTTPMQLYYLYRCGLSVGPAFGRLTLEYVFHKLAVLVYATVMMLFERRWLVANTTGVLEYLPLAYVVVALIILGLVLLCVSPVVQRLARRLLELLPKTEKWQARREEWLGQLDDLSQESRLLLRDKRLCLKALAVQTFKLFLLFTLPYLAIRFMGLGDLGFWQVQLLAAITMFVSNSMPNVAGMGSVEAAFLLVFSGFLGRGGAMSALMLYRIASYYAVFVCSIFVFLAAQRHLEKMK